MSTNQSKAMETLDRYIRARYPLIGVVSHEETRVLEAIKKMTGDKRDVITWSYTQGLVGLPGVDPEMTQEPGAALAEVAKFDPDAAPETRPTLFVFKDLHNMLQDAQVTRYLRDIAANFEVRRHNLIILAPAIKVPDDLDKSMTLLDWPLPDTAELAAILKQSEVELPSRIPVTLNGNRDKVVQAMQGLTAFEARSVLTAGIVATGELGDGVIPFIVKEKANIIRKAGVLEFYDETVTMTEVGGLSNLKRYAEIKRKAFSSEARAAGVDSPKGVLLVGIPGMGKSLSAKAIAGGKMPLLRMDVGALMGGLVGQSESNMRSALKVAEAVAPCVLWVDEIEKALGGIGSGESDGGTTTRVFGTLLTWMQETKAPVYVVATANDVRSLKPELLRRFGDIMFVDLPDAASRREILTVHLSKRGKELEVSEDLVKATWGYSGEELEKVVKAAIETAFFEGQALSNEHLLEAARGVVPIIVTMKE